jgi:hypothetical protein
LWWFVPQVLEKTFYMENPDEVVPEKFVGCTIDWAAGKDTTGEARGGWRNAQEAVWAEGGAPLEGGCCTVALLPTRRVTLHTKT